VEDLIGANLHSICGGFLFTYLKFITSTPPFLSMPKIIEAPARIEAHGQPPKVIEEFVGRVNSATEAVSVARMISPSGWSEPGQTPEFDEVTVVLRGALQVESRAGVHQVSAGQAIIVKRGEWVRYSTPSPEGAEYIAISLPAFSPAIVHRDST
jgi:quercetin dioxygenase-like cupin family protein